MGNFVDNYCEFPTALRRPMWKVWHRLIIKFDKDITANFMNYGYASLNGDTPITLEKEDEVNRYCIQLYDHVVNRVDIKDKNVIEVGSGRGGGAHYISRYYKPKKYTAVDISTGVIDFCNNYYNVEGLSFLHGRAEKIPVENESFDALVNVESARCYSDLNLFFNEVHRVLKPKGKFLFADMIGKEEVAEIKEKIVACGFTILEETAITENVAKGLELDTERRTKLIQKKVPKFLHSSFKSFAGTKGTARFDSFRNGKFEYMSFVIEKN